MSANSTDCDQALRIQFEARMRILGPSIARLGAAGFLAPGELREIVRSLERFRINGLVDLGCGNGRLGCRVASDLECHNYLGVDRIPGSRATADSAVPVTHFVAGDFHELAESLPRTFDGAISHDALYLADRPAISVRALADRIGHGRPLLFTAYVGTGVFEAGVGGRSLAGWRALLTTSGFVVESATDLTRAWRYWARRFHSERLRLCSRSPRKGPMVDRLEAVSRRFLGKDGEAPLLNRLERFRLLATTVAAETD